MPILGLTDRKSVTPRFTRLGKVRKGKLNGNTPVDLSYLRFVGEGPDKEALEALWFETYGREPIRLHLYLPFETVEENWVTWMEKWTAKQGLIHRCNGEHMVQWLDPQTLGQVLDYDLQQRKPCPYATGAKQRTKKDPGCEPVGRLSMILEPFLEAGFPGYITLETGSLNDLANITASLVDTENKARTARRPNRLQGIEFILTRRLENIGVRFQGNEGPVKTKQDKWMLRLDPSREWLQAQLGTTSLMALGGHAPTPAIIDAESTPVAALPAPEPGPTPEPEPTPEVVTREPRSLKEIKAAIAAKVAELTTTEADSQPDTNKKRRGLFVASLEKCFQASKEVKTDSRRLICWYLFDAEEGGSAHVTQAQTCAWLNMYIAEKTTKDKYPLEPFAAAEMSLIFQAAIKETGQLSLPEEGTETPSQGENNDQQD